MPCSVETKKLVYLAGVKCIQLLGFRQLRAYSSTPFQHTQSRFLAATLKFVPAPWDRGLYPRTGHCTTADHAQRDARSAERRNFYLRPDRATAWRTLAIAEADATRCAAESRRRLLRHSLHLLVRFSGVMTNKLIREVLKKQTGMGACELTEA